jgi:putative sulfurtransferase DndC
MAFDRKHLEGEIIEQYLEEDGNKPWILGFSGGKDSTMLLQLVWYAVLKIKPKDRKRSVHIICNNTLVENPKILTFVQGILKKIEKEIVNQKLPFTVNQTTPRIEDSFWINLIGKGYPAPNSVFRWCTERLKISPTTKFIVEKINQDGEVIILLGTRSAESSTRARSLKKHEIKGSRLRRHTLPRALVFPPIKDVTTEEVWKYLLAAPSPWKSKNRDLITLYGNASGGDCPLVTDISTPSCGNSRFGCWVCTVVRKDKSMQGLIDSGEEWMEPLMEIRDFLAFTIDRDAPDYDPLKYRMNTRRNGAKGLGPYHPKWRKHILTEILKAQKFIQKDQPKVVLITPQELVAIQVTWFRDNIFEYDIGEIYYKIFGKKLRYLTNIDEGIKKEKDLLLKSCKGNEGDFKLINDLLNLQKSKVLLMNKRGIHKDLERKLEEHLYPSREYVY